MMNESVGCLDADWLDEDEEPPDQSSPDTHSHNITFDVPSEKAISGLYHRAPMNKVFLKQRLVSLAFAKIAPKSPFWRGLTFAPIGSARPFVDFNHPTASQPPADSLADFPIGERTRDFLRTHYPLVESRQWNDWRWQMRHRIQTAAALARVVDLAPDELAAIARHTGPLPLALTPYYASLLDGRDPHSPLRRTVIPTSDEYVNGPGEAADPLGEEADSPIRSIVHRYPDRVLFLVTGLCSTYCRYCTRSRLVGATGEASTGRAHLEAGLRYIAAHTEIRDVLLSGGDPLVLDDGRLDWLLTRLRAIEHVEIIRIGTKQPVVMPQRITPALVAMLHRHHPLWMSIHFTHPHELTPEVAAACARLADAGLPLGSQTVLLRGINDDVATMRRLVTGLLRIRVRPYYLYQCDPILGSAHFRTPVSRGLEVIAGLRGHTTGYAVPTFVIDAPGGGGKIPLLPEAIVGQDNDHLILRNYQGALYRYPDSSCLDNAGVNQGCVSV